MCLASFRIYIIAAILLIPFLASGQVRFRTIADQTTIGKNQQFQIQFVIENASSVDRFQAPNFPSFVLLQGPIESSSMSVINGSVSQYKAYVYMLQSKKTGTFTIKGASALIDGKLKTSNSVTIRVVDRNVPNANLPFPGLSLPPERPAVNQQFLLRPGENAIDKIKKNLFVKVEVNKKSVYVNEPVVATYKLYSRLRSESRVTKRPSYNGFSVFDMVDPEGGISSTENLNGKLFDVHIIRQSQLFPLQAGNFVLEPVEVENIVRFVKTNSARPQDYDELFNPNSETVIQNITLESKPESIEVKPLPKNGQPADFNGAVGKFKLQAYIEGDSVKAGEVATLHITIKGKGNLQIVNSPTVHWPAGVEAFEPEVSEDIHPETIPLSGEKNFVYRFTSKKSGPITIPSIKLSYFDPATEKYATDSVAELKLEIMNDVKSATSDDIAKEKIKIPRGDNSPLIWTAAFVIVVMGSVWLILSRKAAQKLSRKRKLQKEARDAQLAEENYPLVKASRYLKDGEDLLFLKEVQQVVWQLSAEKLSIPPTALNKVQVIEALRSRGMMKAAEMFNNLIEDIESNLYVPGEKAADNIVIYNRAKEYVSTLIEQ